jgi:hypothetical protein
MQFAGMSRAKCLQCGGGKCITYFRVCPKLDLSDHIHQLIRLGDERFRSKKNRHFIMRLGQCIALAAGPNAPHAILIQLRDRMDPKLWSFVGDQWATASELRYMDKDGKPTSPSAAGC